MKATRFFLLCRFAMIASLALSFAARAQTEVTKPPAPRRPNIIFILADDLGYGDLGCYGQTRIKTPNLDRMAAEGIRFTDFYAGSTVCAPSRAALMLGKHTGHINIRGNRKGQALQPNDLTVATLLQNAGYRTGHYGKWGLGDHGSSGVPNKQGFYTFGGYLDHTEAHDYYPRFIWRYSPIFGKEPFDDQMPVPGNEGGAQGQYSHDYFTKAALNFLRLNKPDQFNHFRPFFLYLAYTIPHANNEEGKRTGNGMQVPDQEPYTNEAWPKPEINKAAMISRLDRDIGQLLQKLKDLQVDDNTAVFFTSDNGPHKEGGADPKFFGSSGGQRGYKRDLYEGGIRVPMIVRWPARIKPGQVSDFAWANWDFLPTAADIAMTQSPTNIDGISVYPLLTGQTQTNRHEYFYWEFHERGFQQAVRMDNWKAVRPQAREKLELYDLKTDAAEKNNVAEKNPEVVAKLEKIFQTARAESDHWPIKGPLEKDEKKPAEKK